MLRQEMHDDGAHHAFHRDGFRHPGLRQVETLLHLAVDAALTPLSLGSKLLQCDMKKSQEGDV